MLRDEAGGSHDKVQKALEKYLTDSQTKLDTFIGHVDGQIDAMVKNISELITNITKIFLKMIPQK